MKICFLLSKGFLWRALGPLTLVRAFYTCGEVKRLLEERRADPGPRSFEAKYLFGHPSSGAETKGVLRCCLEAGQEVALASSWREAAVRRQEIVNVQWSGIGVEEIEVLAHGPRVFGWLPPELDDRRAQVLLLRQACTPGEDHLTRTILIPWGYSATTAETQVWEAFLDSEFLLLKAARGIAGHALSGVPYWVVRRDRLAELVRLYLGLLRREDGGLVISEFIVTDDPYTHWRNHVVHKADLGSESIPRVTYKVPGRFDPHVFGAQGYAPLSDCTRTGYWSQADLGELADFGCCGASVMAAFCRFGAAVSIDFMIPPDGIPRFLELNRENGTFADRLEPDQPTAVDRLANATCMLSPSSDPLEPREIRAWYEDVLKALRMSSPFLIGHRS